MAVQAIVNVMQKNVEAIFLGGGFGKGEGSIKIVEDRVLPLKDYDLMVIVKKRPDKETVNKIYRQIYKNIGVNNCESRLFRFSDFVADLSITTRSRVKSFPDVATYEIKVASQLLYGEDVRKDIPWEITDIPLSSGWRFLYEKMTGLIGHFSQQCFTEGHIDQHKRELLIYECYKTYMEIGTALTLLMGCYAPSFSARVEAFRSNYQTKLPELYEILPDLSAAVENATKFKLDPDFEKLSEDPLDLWFQTRDDLIEVAKFYLSRYLNVAITDFSQSKSVIVHGLCDKYFEPVAKTLCNNYLKTNSTLAIGAANSSLRIFYNVKYILDYRRNKKMPIRILAHPFEAITIRLQAIAPQILLSIRPDGSLDSRHFVSARQCLLSLFPHETIDSFEDLQTAYLTGYRHLWAH